MKIIYNKIIPFKGYLAMTIYPFIFARETLSKVDINHETIHGFQQVEVTAAAFSLIAILSIIFDFSIWYLLLSLPSFYVWYGIEYVVRSIMYDKKKEAYRNISFEQEAYLHEGDLTYIYDRPLFAWFNYLNKKTYIYKKPTIE